jgi:ribosomal protein S18 acetylase RimI-like enzyme
MARTTLDDRPPAAVLPAELAAQGFALRLEADADIPFLAELYASTREAELALAPWSPTEKAIFLRSQFDAQRRHYYSNFHDCVFSVLECDGAPIGRLYLETRGQNLHIVDIALTPVRRGQGLGGRILVGVIAFAAAAGRGVSIYVEKFNPALRLYRRLGFTEVSDSGVYLLMERVAA